MTTNDDNQPIDPDALELDDMLLDLASEGADPTMLEGIKGHKDYDKIMNKYAGKIDNAIKKGKKK